MVTEGERITDSSQCGSDGVAVATVLVLAGKSGRIYRMTRRLFPLVDRAGLDNAICITTHQTQVNAAQRESVCVCVCVYVCVCVCVCVYVCVCVCESECVRECVCECVKVSECVCERERERECVCACLGGHTFV